MRTVALALVGLALALIVGELGVRLFWDVAAPAARRPAKPRSEAEARAAERVAQEDLPVLESVGDLAGRNVRGVHKGLPFRTNRAGFRGPEYAPAPPEGVFRIAIAGDSITMGTGVLEEDTYAARVEASLNERADGARYQVLNLGLVGLNAGQVARRVEKLGMRHAPHLIVYGYTLNDIQGPAYVSTAVTGAWLGRRVRYERFLDSPSFLLRATWPRLLALWELATVPAGTLEYDYEHNYFEHPAAWAQVELAFDALADAAAERDLCVQLLVHTSIAQLNRFYPFVDVTGKVEAAARQRGFGVTQSFPYFEGHDPTQLRLSGIDPHPNADGHALLARALLDGLRELPKRCWAKGPGGVPAALRD